MKTAASSKQWKAGVLQAGTGGTGHAPGMAPIDIYSPDGSDIQEAGHAPGTAGTNSNNEATGGAHPGIPGSQVPVVHPAPFWADRPDDAESPSASTDAEMESVGGASSAMSE